MWARGDAILYECPRSYITGESATLVEEFLARRRLGGTRFDELSARQVDAMVVLEKNLLEELRNGQHSTTATTYQVR